MPDFPKPEALAAIAARARAWADVFKLPLQHRVWRGLAGDFQGSGVGSSLDFQDHRAYMPGDDPRHINWQAYARTGHYTMKLYREEVRPVIDVVFDVSDSMLFRDEKRDRSVELFYFAIFSALKSGAAVSAMLVKGEAHHRLSDELIHSHGWAGLAATMPATASAAEPDLRPLPFRAQSMRILVSDLLFAQSPEVSLRSLTKSRGRGIILAPFLRAEADPDWEGNYEFVDAEAGDRHPHRVDREVLGRYQAAYRRHFDVWKTLSRKYDIILARVPAEPDFQAAIQVEAVSSGALEIWG
ncbi:MAG: DUF58 domain-containing protein [Verrucomicrobiae bacterium]|nr:DUF58 domain-containing protein [Verrucomicrobiae bacterium]MCP5550434.1 DUF58 domain-containing protein [Akkermansiaceae bacterium]